MEDNQLLSYLEDKRKLIDQMLIKLLASENGIPKKLFKAMEYSLMAGGKRIRPILCIATAENYCKVTHSILKAACAIELLHTYSLIHDDLPSMDNDDFRRGKPTCHKVFGEATAILAGDALQAMAFKWLSELGLFYNSSCITNDTNSTVCKTNDCNNCNINFENNYIARNSFQSDSIDATTVVKIINVFSNAVGASGMVGGQILDLSYQNQEFTHEQLEEIHLKKTAALISSSIEIGALLAKVDNSNYKSDYNILKEYGLKLGLLFQVVDDLLDETGTFSSLGKTPQKDRKDKKATYIALYGLEKTKNIAKCIHDEAINLLNKLQKPNNILYKLTNYILYRTN